MTDEREMKYALDLVPLHVMCDLLSNWPEDVAQPADLSAFEFAARRRGRGNHRWIIKFRGLEAIRVAYGGYEKKQATVARENTCDEDDRSDFRLALWHPSGICGSRSCG